jgi:phosphatidylserine/phosphatidylglycerophosphate/cardiolipin synthase-like enzyme
MWYIRLARKMRENGLGGRDISGLAGPGRSYGTSGKSEGEMIKGAYGVMRRSMTAVFLSILLLLPLTGGAAKPEGQAPADSPKDVAQAKLLLDGDYITALLSGIDHAREEIFLSVYLFRTIEHAQGCPEAVLKSLCAAVGRGVRVKAILERNRDTDDISRSNAETMQRLRQGGIRVCLDAPNRQTHTKLIVIDRRYLLIGSHNLTQSALRYNHEASVWIDSAPLAEEVLRYMKSLCPGDGR